MRIAIFTDTYLPTVNGVARALGALVRHALRAGHEIALVTPPVDVVARDVTLHQIMPGRRFFLYPELRACAPLLAASARGALEEFAPDVVHAATEAGVGLAGRRFALARGIPLVTSFNTLFPEYLAGYRLGALEPALWRYLRWFHGGADLTVTPSEWMRRELLRRGFHARLALWSRGVDAELFHPARRSDALRAELAPAADVILLYVGRLAAEKKVGLLLDAFASVRARASVRTALALVGNGPALPELRARAGEGVVFTGYRTGMELAAHYASADVFVFPSDTETFGQVVTEAHASGLPAVVPDRGGVTDIVVPGRSGRRFRPGDAASFAAAIVDLVHDAALRSDMGRVARADAEQRSWEAVGTGLIGRYEILASLAKGPASTAAHRRLAERPA